MTIFVIIKQVITYFRRTPSVTVIVLACLTVLQIHLNLAKYNNNNVFKWDVSGYYSYLPAIFIDKDISLKFVTEENNKAKKGIKYWYQEDEKGNRIIKYSVGMSVMYAPFFGVAHVLAKPLGYNPDGFSSIYEFFIEFSGLFYLIIGLHYLRKLLLIYYDEQTTALTLLFIFFGTNLLYYSSVESAMSHAYTFSLFSVMLYFTIKFYQNPKYKYSIIISVCFGLITLIRPLNILLIVPFLLYNIKSYADVKYRLQFWLKQYKHILVFILLFIITITPQLLYYKTVTDNYFVFSYGKESFIFSRFNLHKVLFSFRKGWFIYTPIMLFAISGIYFLFKKTNNPFKTTYIIFLPFYVYLVSAWWCWWYGGSYSQRALIDIYPLLSISLAAFIFHLKSTVRFKKQLAYTGLIFCLLLNLFQTLQYKYNIIDYDGMTAKAYVHVFGTINSNDIKPELLDKPNYERALIGAGE